MTEAFNYVFLQIKREISTFFVELSSLFVFSVSSCSFNTGFKQQGEIETLFWKILLLYLLIRFFCCRHVLTVIISTRGLFCSSSVISFEVLRSSPWIYSIKTLIKLEIATLSIVLFRVFRKPLLVSFLSCFNLFMFLNFWIFFSVQFDVRNRKFFSVIPRNCQHFLIVTCTKLKVSEFHDLTLLWCRCQYL